MEAIDNYTYQNHSASNQMLVTPEKAYALLQRVTCDCKDDGQSFRVTDRIEVIKDYLSDSDYTLLAEEDIFLLYGKKPLEAGAHVILVSSHIDCVFQHCFCREEEYCYRGTFDNSFTNAALLQVMKQGNLPENVVIAFTGDEEKGSAGAIGVNVYLTRMECTIDFALVLDVTLAGWEHQHLFAIENDLGIDLLTAHQIVEWLRPYQGKYEFLHQAEPDETWDYADYGIPCMTLSAPVDGQMHGEDGVIVRKQTYPVYCDVLQLIVSGLARLNELC